MSSEDRTVETDANNEQTAERREWVAPEVVTIELSTAELGSTV